MPFPTSSPIWGVGALNTAVAVRATKPSLVASYFGSTFRLARVVVSGDARIRRGRHCELRLGAGCHDPVRPLGCRTLAPGAAGGARGYRFGGGGRRPRIRSATAAVGRGDGCPCPPRGHARAPRSRVGGGRGGADHGPRYLAHTAAAELPNGRLPAVHHGGVGDGGDDRP